MSTAGKSKANLQCYFCSKPFGKFNDLRRHLYIHTREEGYQCPQCNILFPQRQKLYKHVSDIHTKNTFSCAKCLRKFYKEEKYKDHILTHEGKATIKCPNCPRLYHSQYKLRVHIRRVHTGKIHKCNLCQRVLSSSYTLKQHVEAVHEKLKNKTCSFCPKMFYANAHLILHMNRVHFKQKVIGKCSEPGCNFVFNNETSAYLHRRKYHPRHNEQTEFKCEVCKKIFPSKHGLTQHVKIHSSVRERYECTFCHKLYYSKLSLNDHITSAHTAERAFKCDWNGCSKEFSKAGNLILHKTAHRDKELGLKFKCQNCSRTYQSNTALQMHTATHKSKHICYFCKLGKNSHAQLVEHFVIHTGERPYNCQKCGKEFRRGALLKRHIKRWHDDPRPLRKQRNCYFCQQRMDYQLIPKHIREHTKEMFICKKCRVEFATSYELKKHNLSVHKKNAIERKCYICHKVLSSTNALWTHMTMHTGEKSIKCAKCQKSFANHDYLRTHKKWEHN